MGDGQVLFDRNISVVLALSDSLPLSNYHRDLMQPFSRCCHVMSCVREFRYHLPLSMYGTYM